MTENTSVVVEVNLVAYTPDRQYKFDIRSQPGAAEISCPKGLAGEVITPAISKLFQSAVSEAWESLRDAWKESREGQEEEYAELSRNNLVEVHACAKIDYNWDLARDLTFVQRGWELSKAAEKLFSEHVAELLLVYSKR